MYANCLDKAAPIPRYVTWHYATMNRRNDSEVGRRLLYEVGGETVPASDSENFSEDEMVDDVDSKKKNVDDETLQSAGLAHLEHGAQASLDGNEKAKTCTGIRKDALERKRELCTIENGSKDEDMKHDGTPLPEEARTNPTDTSTDSEPYWQAIDDYVIQSTVKEFDRHDKRVIQALAAYAETTPEMIRKRIATLEGALKSTVDFHPKTNVSRACNVEDAMDTHRTLFCRRCRVFDCKRQCFGYNPPPRDRSLWPRMQTQGLESPLPCSRNCWKSPADTVEKAKTVGPDIFDDESYLDETLVMLGKQIFGPDPCIIAKLLPGQKCRDIKSWLEEHPEDLTELPSPGTQDGKSARKKGNKRKHSRGAVTPAALAARKQIKKSGKIVLPAYVPCNCNGMCSLKTCSCAKNGNFCEKFCQCSASCQYRFPGCRCKKGQCRTNACPCFAAGRECDPDLCLSCISSLPPHGLPSDTTAGSSEKVGPPQGCQNMNLLLRHHRHVQMGISDIHGWGAFLKGDAEKNSFLGEYTGELISHEEADRRGKVYDRVNSSYLFNLNSEFVVDAFLRGNKFRFANHSPHPNCYAKVLQVEGEHRVGIFARERIKDGDELLYNYMYDKEKEVAMVQKSQRKNP